MTRNESDVFNVGLSKLPKVASRPAGGLGDAVSAPAGYGAAPGATICEYPRVVYNN